jgi:uncharacterized membrane protein
MGMGTMAICLFLEGILVTIALHYYIRRQYIITQFVPGKALGLICGVMVLLVFGNLIQIGIWAALFDMLSEFSTYPDAFYHSAVNFSTLGYGDHVMSEKHRLLGPLEAVNGIVMVGVSVAVLISVFQDVAQKKIK